MEWVGVRRCASDIMGESYAIKLNISRTLEKERKISKEQEYGKLVFKTTELLSKDLRYSPVPEVEGN